ncbi:hypothetical protein FDUTEX481_06840 [Tolypothrix sp. PCC 7601]|nr:hypothetical protein FDUTEX481_06840 [Tolypothrix sp. PCC 7601]
MVVISLNTQRSHWIFLCHKGNLFSPCLHLLIQKIKFFYQNQVLNNTKMLLNT